MSDDGFDEEPIQEFTCAKCNNRCLPSSGNVPLILSCCNNTICRRCAISNRRNSFQSGNDSRPCPLCFSSRTFDFSPNKNKLMKRERCCLCQKKSCRDKCGTCHKSFCYGCILTHLDGHRKDISEERYKKWSVIKEKELHQILDKVDSLRDRFNQCLNELEDTMNDKYSQADKPCEVAPMENGHLKMLEEAMNSVLNLIETERIVEEDEDDEDPLALLAALREKCNRAPSPEDKFAEPPPRSRGRKMSMW